MKDLTQVLWFAAIVIAVMFAVNRIDFLRNIVKGG
jgi:hypothetical protein